MKKYLAAMLMMLLLACVTFVGCGDDDDAEPSGNTEITEKAEPTESEPQATPTEAEEEPSPTPTAEPTIVEEDRRPAVTGGSVFVDFSGKGLEEIVNNILDIRTISANTTISNFVERFDTAPNPVSAGADVLRAEYVWLPADCGSDEYLANVAVASDVTDTGKIDLSVKDGADPKNILHSEGGGNVYIVIELKNKELAEAVFKRVGDIIRRDYEETYELPEDECPADPVNENYSKGYWIIQYENVRHVSLTWKESEQVYELAIEISLRYAK